MRICPTCGACSEDAYDLCAFDGSLLGEGFPGSRVLAERYVLEQRVAAGAMGVVFRALHLQIGSTVAVKLMQPESEELQVGLVRFHREAQILGQIKHPNAVLVMDFGVEKRAAADIPFLVTEFLRGQSLADRLEEKPVFTLAEAAKIIVPICEAVEEAHQVGVIHRDLKPSNIFLERLRDGTEIVKVLDFGIAKFVELTPDVLDRLQKDHADLAATYQRSLDVDLLDEVVGVRAGGGTTTLDGRLRARDDASPATPTPTPHAKEKEREKGADATLTEAGFMIGTIPWMAPEQMTGERVSRQTDVYAVASLLYRLLTGRLPFEGTDDDVINAKVSDERPTLAEAGLDAPGALEELMVRAFALEPEERPESVLELARALKAAVQGARAPVAGDVPLALSIQLGALGRALAQTQAAVTAFQDAPAGTLEDGYHRARDQLLSLDAPLERAEDLLAELSGDDEGEVELLRGAVGELDEHVDALATAVRPLVAHPENEFAEYLGVIWTRAHTAVQGLVRVLDERLRAEEPATTAAPAPAPVTDLFGGGGGADEAALLPAIDDLERGDALTSDDAFELLVGEESARAARLLMKAAHAPTDVVRRLVRGLWRHADRLLLAELYPDTRALRLLPSLTALGLPEAAPFRRLGAIFTGSPQGDTTAHGSIEDALLAIEDEGERRVLWRCLLAHPLFSVRKLAADRVELSELWNLVVHPKVRPSLLRPVFDAVVERARPEYLKVFFLCAREPLAAPSTVDDLDDAFLMVQRMFTVPCFHEDLVFEPLLELDRILRERAKRLGREDPPAAYADQLAAFTARGVVETEPPESMRDVPLPIQRKLAREGCFLQYFACHANDRVAKETVPHLLRLEDIIRFLRLPTLHRAVLLDLARERRFFRKEAARIALLQNPKTPANVARVYLPLLGHEQVRLLAHNKHIGGEVRTLANTFLDKLAGGT